jgi:hypothetical protein
LRVVEVEAVEAPSARLPPPAALQHGGAVEAGPVVVSIVSGERTVVAAVPGVVEGVPSVTLVTVDF